MLAVCFALTASACGDGGAVITDGTKTEGAADGKKAETGTTRLVSVENVEKYITIGEYKGLTLDNTVDAITDDDVQAQIDEDLKDKAAFTNVAAIPRPSMGRGTIVWIISSESPKRRYCTKAVRPSTSVLNKFCSG